jgi:hypothetical protein
VKTTEADADELAPADAERLRALVAEAGLFDLSSAGGSTALPDVQSYELTVEDGGRHNTVVLGERELTPQVRALLDWVRSVRGR